MALLGRCVRDRIRSMASRSGVKKTLTSRSPATPSAAQIAALQQGMDPVPLGATQTLVVAGGAVSLSFDLPRFGISLVTRSLAAGATDASTDVPADAEAPTPDGGGAKGGGGGCACAVTTGGEGAAPHVLALLVLVVGLAAFRRRVEDDEYQQVIVEYSNV